jgi:hypothetical protein
VVTITIKLPADLAAKLAAEARAKGVSKSAIIRDALEKRYAKSRAKKSFAFYDRIKHLPGSVKDPPTDLSTNKKYMKGFGE